MTTTHWRRHIFPCIFLRYLRVPPPPVTPFLHYDTFTTIAQTLRYLQLISRIRKLIIEVYVCMTSILGPQGPMVTEAS